jgi:hypothetical protein
VCGVFVRDMYVVGAMCAAYSVLYACALLILFSS